MTRIVFLSKLYKFVNLTYERDHMKDLNTLVLDFAKLEEATSTGITTRETLVGGPPSVDLEYVLGGARSAITFAVAMDPACIP